MLLLPWSPQAFRRTWPFWAGLLLFWLAGIIWVLRTGHGASFLALRPAQPLWWERGFLAFTFLGDGLFVVLLCLWAWWRRRYAWVVLLFGSYALSGLLAQACKYWFHLPRPATWFGSQGLSVRAVEGHDLLRSYTSFPSGHTASAFALAAALVLGSTWWGRRWWLALGLAIMVGYSRVLLGQHFPADVLGGSVLGAGTTLVVWLLMNTYAARRQPGS